MKVHSQRDHRQKSFEALPSGSQTSYRNQIHAAGADGKGGGATRFYHSLLNGKCFSYLFKFYPGPENQIAAPHPRVRGGQGQLLSISP
jgi:hypothetical protein